MELIPSTNQSLAKVGWQWFSVAPSFRPLFVLANQVVIDVQLVGEVVRDRAVDLFEPQKLEVLADRLRRFAARNAWTIESSEIRVSTT